MAASGWRPTSPAGIHRRDIGRWRATGGRVRLPKGSRLRRAVDFSAVYAQQHKVHGTYVVCFSRFGATARARVGITASKKVGNAVTRNRVRRRIREWTRRRYADLPADLDLVIVAREAAAHAQAPALFSDLDSCLTRVRPAAEA